MRNLMRKLFRRQLLQDLYEIEQVVPMTLKDGVWVKVEA